ncbi:hypothetical protein BVZ80_01304B, partial [Haemophilus influenzae]
PSWNGILLLF